MQFTLPGVPCIYYGDEAGMEGYRDPFNRACYPWGHEDEDLIAWYRYLGLLRQEHGDILKGGGLRSVYAHDNVLSFERYVETEGGEDALFVAVNRSMENALVDLLPRSMIPVVLRRLDISPEMQANSLTKQKRRALVELLKAFPIDITGKRPVSEAIITSGGVKVSEIDPKTMESKLVAGLHFAGEVIDCDAYTGGFNLQIAWATAYAAGMAVG